MYNATVFLVFLYGMELGLSCKGKNMLRRIFGPKGK
jgi:hypothetical protein